MASTDTNNLSILAQAINILAEKRKSKTVASRTRTMRSGRSALPESGRHCVPGDGCDTLAMDVID